MKNNNDLMKIYKELLENNDEIDIITMQDSFDNKKWFDIIAKGCSKSNAIKYLKNYLNIDTKDIIAFGDGLNDIEMLKECGRGVALLNALYEVKEVADDITKYDNDHDSVIEYLKLYLKDECLYE